MPFYQYAAIEATSNKLLEGRLEAASLKEAKEALRNMGHFPTRLEEEASSMTVTQVIHQIPVVGGLLTPKATLKDICLMTEQLASLIDAGIPLIESLLLLEQQSSNQRLKTILKQVRLDVISGDTFHHALSKYSTEFSHLYIHMIRAGETSGNMDLITNRLAALLTKYLELQNKIQQALTYPAFTVVVVCAVVVIIMVVVVPQFESLYSNYNAELPLPTKILITSSYFFQHFWWAVVIALSGFIFWFNVFRKGTGKALVDQWLITIPLIGPVIRKIAVSRFIRTLGMTLASGISLTEGIVTSAGTVDNYVYQLAFEKAKESLLIGGTLAKPLELSGMFPPMVVRMIATGEETGKLETMLNKSADFLDRDVEKAITTMTTLIEPIMIVVLGGLILMVALALYLPIFDMSKVITSQ